jgi:hypothetical protein
MDDNSSMLRGRARPVKRSSARLERCGRLKWRDEHRMHVRSLFGTAAVSLDPSGSCFYARYAVELRGLSVEHYGGVGGMYLGDASVVRRQDGLGGASPIQN